MERLACALSSALVGGAVQRARYDGAGGLSLRFRQGGRNLTLLLSTKKGSVGVGIIEKPPPSPPRPHALASYLRAHLEGGRLTDVFFTDKHMRLDFLHAGEKLSLHFEAPNDFPRLFVADAAGVAKVSERWDSAEGGVRPGKAIEGPDLGPATRTSDIAWAISFLEGEGARLFSPSEPKPVEEKRVRRWRGKLMRRIENIEKDLAALPSVESLAGEAEQAAANLWLDPGGGRRIDALYRAAKKARRARAIGDDRRALALAELEKGPSPEAAHTPRPQPASVASQPYRRYKSSDGWRILVGRNRHENDKLVREARPWDLWLHALDGSGAHVVIVKPGREANAPERTLREAAALAAHFSSLSDERAVDVTWAEASRVTKPKGAGPGRVVVAGGRTLRVAPDAAAAKLISEG